MERKVIIIGSPTLGQIEKITQLAGDREVIIVDDVSKLSDQQRTSSTDIVLPIKPQFIPEHTVCYVDNLRQREAKQKRTQDRLRSKYHARHL